MIVLVSDNWVGMKIQNFYLYGGLGKFHTNLELLSRDSSQLLINNSSCKLNSF